MLTRKTKLLGGTLLLLGAPTGASLSALDLGSFSWDNLFSSSGGALINQPDLTEKKKLEVGDTVKKIGLSEQKEIITPELQEVKELIDLSSQEKITAKDSTPTIRNTYLEITREGKALKLDEDSTRKAREYQSKSKKHLKKYLEGKAKIERFAQFLQQSQSRRTKRSASKDSSYPQLTQEERSALLEMYKLFEELDKEKEKLDPRLYELDKSIPRALAVKSRPSRSQVESNLSKIRWSTQREVEYTTERSRGYGSSNSPNIWLEWGKNPYKVFLGDSSEYTSLMQKISQAIKEKENYLKSKRGLGLFGMIVGPDAVKSAYAGKNAYDSKVGNARADFANKVALKMLTWMGQYKQR